MSIAVAIKVSSELAATARAEAVGADRSMTGQIEHWAKLGRAAEAIMPSQIATALKRCGGDLESLEDESVRGKILDALAAFQAHSPASLRKKIGVDQQIRFEPDPDNPGGFIRIGSDGAKVPGVMNGRTFVPNPS